DKFASLEAFVSVVEEGGFAAAGRALGKSRSQVNKAVIGLEDRLGVQLLNRTTRVVSPTPAGRAYYDRARTALGELAEAETALQDEETALQGELKINAPMTFGTMHLGPAIVDFMAQHPGLRVDLTLSDRFVDPVADGFDVTVRIAEPKETPSLIDHEIVEIRRVLCAAPDHIGAHGAPAAPEALAERPCLHYGNLPAGNTWRLTGPDGRVRDVRVNGVLCSNNGEVLRDAAVKGLGFALLPTFIVGADMQAGRLIAVLPEFRPPPVSLCLLYAPQRHLSVRMRAFVQFLYERFGGRPHWDLVE
ncbi:MAG: LysR substrate-binding domain-containing protein, partial [Pseudomonadota bacterium]